MLGIAGRNATDPVAVGVEALVGEEVATRNVRPITTSAMLSQVKGPQKLSPSKVVVTPPDPVVRVIAGPPSEVTIVASLPLIAKEGDGSVRRDFSHLELERTSEFFVNSTVPA
jgi:hypothetical protein